MFFCIITNKTLKTANMLPLPFVDFLVFKRLVMKNTFVIFFVFAVAVTTVFAAPKNKREKPADGSVFESVTVSSTDTKPLNTQDEGINRDIKSMSVTNDGKSVAVTLEFNGTPAFKYNDRIVILVDNINIGTEKTLFPDRLWRNPATYTTAKSSIEFNGIEIVGQGIKSNNMRTTAKWKKDDATGIYTLEGEGNSITYTFSLIGIKDNTGVSYPTDTLRLVAITSEYWEKENPRLNGTTHVCDVVPSSSSLVWQEDTKNDSIKIDFNGGLEVPPLKQK